MEPKYIFGEVERNGVTVENLKVVSREHLPLEGFVSTVRKFADCTITDRFRIVERYRDDEDEEGNLYAFYVISDHYRYVDKSKPLRDELTTANLQTQQALAELAWALMGGGTDAEM